MGKKKILTTIQNTNRTHGVYEDVLALEFVIDDSSESVPFG